MKPVALKDEVGAISGRFRAPDLPQGYLDRPRLTSLLKEGLEVSAIWLLAGPGWGKTVSMASLARSCNRPVAWLRLEQQDADTTAFVSSLLTALRRVVPAFGARLQLRLNRCTDIEAFRAIVGELESKIGAKGILVCLEDFDQVADSQPVLEGAEYVMDHAPPGVTFAITSRREPAIGQTRMLVQGKITILQEEELAFTREEMEGYLRASGLELSPESLDQLEAKLGGWPACLALAARHPIVARAADLKDSLPNRETIYDYLSQELLDRLPKALQSFLLRTGLLEEVDMATASVLAPGQDAPALLQLIERRHIPLSRSSEPPVWRYHPLFRDFLRHQASISLPQEDIREIHQAAARVLLENRNLAGAFDHYLMAGQTMEAATILANEVRQLLHHQRFLMLARLIDRLPADLVDSFPVLCLARGKAFETQGNYHAASVWYEKARDRAQEGEVWGLSLAYLGDLHRVKGELDEGARLLASSLGPLAEPEKGWVLASLSGVYMLRDRPLEAEKAIRDLLTLAQKTASPALEASGRHVLGLLQFFHLGKPDQGLENIRKSVAMSREAGSESLSLSLAVLSLFELLQGDPKAVETAKAAIATAEDGGSARHLGLALGVLGWALAEQGKREESRKILRRGTELLQDLNDPWFIFTGYIGLARSNELSGDEQAAIQSYDSLKELAKRLGSALYFSWSLLLEAGFNVRRYGIEKAEQNIIEALEQAKLADAPFVLIPAYLRTSQLQMSRGLRAAAEEHLLQAVSLAADTGYRRPQGIEPWELSRIMRKATAYNSRLRATIAKFGHVWRMPLPALRIRTLGAFKVLRDGSAVSEKEWQRPAVRRLFQFLLVHREYPVNREQLTEAMWPHLTRATASNSSKAKLALLRRVLEPEGVGVLAGGRLIAKAGCIQLYLDTEDWLDVVEFEDGLRGARLTVSPKEKASLLEEALRLYTGPFLSQEPYQDWAAPERERLRLLHQKALADLAWCYEEIGEPSQALLAWNKIFEEELSQEEACRGLMRCYAQLGKSAEVARTYERCREALERELGISPGQETRDLYQKALAQLSREGKNKL